MEYFTFTVDFLNRYKDMKQSNGNIKQCLWNYDLRVLRFLHQNSAAVYFLLLLITTTVDWASPRGFQNSLYSRHALVHLCKLVNFPLYNTIKFAMWEVGLFELSVTVLILCNCSPRFYTLVLGVNLKKTLNCFDSLQCLDRIHILIADLHVKSWSNTLSPNLQRGVYPD